MDDEYIYRRNAKDGSSWWRVCAFNTWLTLPVSSPQELCHAEAFYFLITSHHSPGSDVLSFAHLSWALNYRLNLHFSQHHCDEESFHWPKMFRIFMFDIFACDSDKCCLPFAGSLDLLRKYLPWSKTDVCILPCALFIVDFGTMQILF